MAKSSYFLFAAMLIFLSLMIDSGTCESERGPHKKNRRCPPQPPCICGNETSSPDPLASSSVAPVTTPVIPVTTPVVPATSPGTDEGNLDHVDSSEESHENSNETEHAEHHHQEHNHGEEHQHGHHHHENGGHHRHHRRPHKRCPTPQPCICSTTPNSISSVPAE